MKIIKTIVIIITTVTLAGKTVIKEIITMKHKVLIEIIILTD